ncbi:MAG: hypothetical protein ACK55I_34395, partial [bacterium]
GLWAVRDRPQWQRQAFLRDDEIDLEIGPFWTAQRREQSSSVEAQRGFRTRGVRPQDPVRRSVGEVQDFPSHGRVIRQPDHKFGVERLPHGRAWSCPTELMNRDVAHTLRNEKTHRRPSPGSGNRSRRSSFRRVLDGGDHLSDLFRGNVALA